jgi:hypothetical protein
MPSDNAVQFFEIVVAAGLVAVTAVTVFFSFSVAVALLCTRPKKVALPVAAAEPKAESARPLMPAAA